MDRGGGSRPLRSRSGDSRGQSELLGVVMLFAVAIIGIAVAVMLGTPMLGAGVQSAEVERAEVAMGQFDSRASAVALDEMSAGSQRVDVGAAGDEGELRTREDNWIRLQLVNQTTGSADVVAVNQTMGAVQYERDRTTVAYEGGGVWRFDDGGSVMVSRPEFHYRNGTLTLPIIDVDGDRGLGDEVRVSAGGPAERHYPDESANLTNTVSDTKVEITVRSEYYEAWGRYFERSTDGFVRYDHEAETTTVKFLALSDSVRADSGIFATAGSGTFELHGTGDSGGYVDSYDSRRGDYESTNGNNATVEAVNDVHMHGNSTIWGDLRSGGTVNFSGNPDVFGDIYWTDEPKPDPGSVDNEENITRIDGVATVEPIDGYVSNAVQDIRANNNNSEPSDSELNLDDNTLKVGKSETATLHSGRYYLENMTVNGGDLTLNTTRGDIVLAVRDCMLINNESNKNANLDIEGNGTVRVFAASENQCEVSAQGKRYLNLHVGKQANVDIPDENSSQLRVYATKDYKAAIMGSNGHQTTFDGVIYAPAGLRGEGYVFLMHADLYGSVVSGSVVIDQDGAVHHDHGIEDVALPRSPTRTRLEYMHVTTHPINVTSP